ncbi:MAG: CPBP family intramembrane metalloprotease [Candidatus Gastranaerophilales bacterium]|nr:CPBP family intramembrane metalloprotease [Candidatus Gastranaerophilales bacterium]
MSKENLTSIEYSIVTIVCTALVGWIIISFFPDGFHTWTSVLFILMNLLPMMIAFLFSKVRKEVKGVGEFFKMVFLQREPVIAYVFAVAVVLLYYGVSAILKNVEYTKSSVFAVLAYLPWTILQGGLEEVGWRWYLQTHLNIRNSLILKFAAISIVWFIWHFPLYQLPWITSASSNYAIFYLMILGNTFTFGAVKEMSKGAVPCILAHILIDSLAVIMLVQSKLLPILVLVVVEITASLVAIRTTKRHTV